MLGMGPLAIEMGRGNHLGSDSARKVCEVDARSQLFEEECSAKVDRVYLCVV